MDDPLWSVAELRALGDSWKDVRRKTVAGELMRVRRGIYATAKETTLADRYRRLIRATWRGLGPGAVISHASAAVLHGLPVEDAWLTHVFTTRPGGGHGSENRCTKVYRGRLPAEHVVGIDGMRVTSLARTAVDLARERPITWGVIEMDAALRLDATRSDLASVIAAGARQRGNVTARAALGLADERSESPLESMSRVQMVRFRIPTPQLQYQLSCHEGFVARGDFAWPEVKLLGECDGRIKYSGLLKHGQDAADVVMADRRREERIRQLGWWVVRWGWKEAQDGAALAELISGALKVARARTAA